MIETYYQIRAKKSNNEFQYIATDNHSGGYPYWTSSMRSAEDYTYNKVKLKTNFH